MKTQKHNLGVLMVLVSALMFGSYGVWSRLIGDAMGNFYQGWTRAALILLLLLPIVYVRKEFIKIRRSDWKWMSVFLVFTAFTQAPIFYAFNHMDIGAASLLFFISMFMTMQLFGLVFLGEKMNFIKGLAILLGVVGLLFVFSDSLRHFVPLAAAMALLNGVASGGEVASSKKLSESYSPLYLVTLSWFIILPTNALFSVALGESQLIPTLTSPWFWQVCYALAAMLGFWLVIAGVKYIEAGRASLIGLTEIVFSVVFGIMLFKETLTLPVAVGGLLILVAAALPHLSERRTQTSETL